MRREEQGTRNREWRNGKGGMRREEGGRRDVEGGRVKVSRHTRIDERWKREEGKEES